MRVSREAPANMFGQGALIAEYCRERGLSPDYMREALLTDSNAILKIINMGDRAHVRRNADVSPLGPDTVRRQIYDSFSTGTTLLDNNRLCRLFINSLNSPNSR